MTDITIRIGIFPFPASGFLCMHTNPIGLMRNIEKADNHE